jgi:predicted transcriptional regulator
MNKLIVLRRGVNFQGYSQRQIATMLQIAKIANYDYLKSRVKINYIW